MLAKRAFEPDFLKRLDGLILGIKRARTARIGPRTLGRVQGIGIELENFKDYVEGDDLRFLDWNAVGRLDELFIRTFRAEREIEVTILIDTSASMALPAKDDKLGLALALGAALAYVGMNENDAVRLVAFGAHHGKTGLTQTQFHRRRESYLGLLPFVQKLKGEGAASLNRAVEQLLLARRQPGMVVLISDFLVAASDYETALTKLQAARNEVKVLHVMGERESTGTLAPGFYRMRDCESGQIREIVLGPQAAAACRAKVEQISRRLREFCAARSITYVAAFGAGNLDRIITQEFPRLGLVR
ncbi:MAG TPA: DUF58 domain-containing protein [Candidatus Binataceae bacterium]|nr:DUF58 domain-containing protein [Candidatus Binataceae bacterium]